MGRLNGKWDHSPRVITVFMLRVQRIYILEMVIVDLVWVLGLSTSSLPSAELVSEFINPHHFNPRRQLFYRYQL